MHRRPVNNSVGVAAMSAATGGRRRGGGGGKEEKRVYIVISVSSDRSANSHAELIFPVSEYTALFRFIL